MISTFSTNNGLILAGARVHYALARDALFFNRAGTVNARHVPAVALLAQGGRASLLTPPRTVTIESAGSIVYGNVYSQLLEYIISTEFVFYALMVGAIIVLRRMRPEADRPYRTIGYPVTPLIYIAIALLLVVDLAYLAPATSGTGFLVVLSGVPVYLMPRRRTTRAQPAPPTRATRPCCVRQRRLRLPSCRGDTKRHEGGRSSEPTDSGLAK